MVASSSVRPALALLLLAGLCFFLPRLHAGEDSPALPDLVKALRDDDAIVRKRAAVALERLGPKAHAAAPALEKVLQDSDSQVRAAAAAALEKIDTQRSLDALLRQLHEGKTAAKRREACKALAERHGHDPAATAALEAALADPDVKLEAARALEAIDSHARTKTPAGSAPRPATRIALINQKYVVLNYQKFKTFNARLKTEYRDYDKRMQDLNAKLEGLKKELSNQPPLDKATRAAKEKEATQIQREMQDLADEAKKVLGEKEADELVIIYKELGEAVRAYAEANDIDVVLHYNDGVTPAEVEATTNVQRKMMTGPCIPIYVKKGVDVSEAILTMLNEHYKKPAADTGGR